MWRSNKKKRTLKEKKFHSYNVRKIEGGESLNRVFRMDNNFFKVVFHGKEDC